MLVFDERGKPEYPGKNLSWQSRGPTNSIHIWRRMRKSNPDHIGGRHVLSPLGQRCHHYPILPPPPSTYPMLNGHVVQCHQLRRRSAMIGQEGEGEGQRPRATWSQRNNHDSEFCTSVSQYDLSSIVGDEYYLSNKSSFCNMTTSAKRVECERTQSIRTPMIHGKIMQHCTIYHCPI